MSVASMLRTAEHRLRIGVAGGFDQETAIAIGDAFSQRDETRTAARHRIGDRPLHVDAGKRQVRVLQHNPPGDIARR
jgi:nucleoside phosphorylase